MVIKPGTHTLKVRYWVKDVVTDTEGTITRTYPSTLYASNTYYDMKANLNVRDYDGTKYYMWDAQQNYWAGHEWNSADPWQPVLNFNSNDNYAMNNTDPYLRWYHEGGGSGRFDATQSCATLPNANELSWYCMYGDPRWDEDELWTTMGHLYKGGMWFKKKSVLQAEHHYNTEKSADGLTDLRTTYKYYQTNGGSINSGVPSAAEAGNYFYLPALGDYTTGYLSFIGYRCNYWSSSANPLFSYQAYYLLFSSEYLVVAGFNRNGGFRVGGFE